MLRRITFYMTRICKLGALLAFSVLVVAVLTQVVGRVVGISAVWTEEMTRFALIYLTAFGTGLAFVTGDLVNVDIFCESFPGDVPRKLRMVASFLTAILCLALMPGATKYVEIGLLQKSPAMGLPMEFVHFSVWLLLGLLAAFSVLRFFLDLARIPYRRYELDEIE